MILKIIRKLVSKLTDLAAVVTRRKINKTNKGKTHERPFTEIQVRSTKRLRISPMVKRINFLFSASEIFKQGRNSN